MGHMSENAIDDALLIAEQDAFTAWADSKVPVRRQVRPDIRRVRFFVYYLQLNAPCLLDADCASLYDGVDDKRGAFCHGPLGEYALALQRAIAGKWYDSSTYESDWYKTAGADLARFLFFSPMARIEDLLTWATDYPEIWGNAHGGLMLTHACAYGGPIKGCGLFDSGWVKDKWAGVLARMEAHKITIAIDDISRIPVSDDGFYCRS